MLYATCSVNKGMLGHLCTIGLYDRHTLLV